MKLQTVYTHYYSIGEEPVKKVRVPKTAATKPITPPPQANDDKGSKKSPQNVSDFSLLRKLFPQHDRTVLLDALLNCDNNVTDTIRQLLLSPIRSSQRGSPKIESAFSTPATSAGVNEPFVESGSNENLGLMAAAKLAYLPHTHNRYLAAAAAMAASGATTGAATSGTTQFPSPYHGLAQHGLLPGTLWRPEFAQYLSTAQHHLSRAANMQLQQTILSGSNGSDSGFRMVNRLQLPSTPPPPPPLNLHVVGDEAKPFQSASASTLTTSSSGDLESGSSPTHSAD